MRRLALPILPILAVLLGIAGIWIGGRNAVAPLAFSGMAVFYSGLAAFTEVVTDRKEN